MIKFIRDLYRYLYPPAPFHQPINNIVTKYPAKELNTRDDETYLVRLGIARTRDHARYLMVKYGVNNAEDLIRGLPKRKKRNRFYDLLLRIDGHDNRDPYKTKKHDKLPMKYWFRE